MTFKTMMSFRRLRRMNFLLRLLNFQGLVRMCAPCRITKNQFGTRFYRRQICLYRAMVVLWHCGPTEMRCRRCHAICMVKVVWRRHMWHIQGVLTQVHTQFNYPSVNLFIIGIHNLKVIKNFRCTVDLILLFKDINKCMRKRDIHRLFLCLVALIRLFALFSHSDATGHTKHFAFSPSRGKASTQWTSKVNDTKAVHNHGIFILDHLKSRQPFFKSKISLY